MKLPNIFFAGFAGSGKTYCTQYLINKYYYTHAKVANNVYMIAEKYLEMKNKDRKLLQFLGTEVGREMIDNNLWISRFADDIWIAQETAKKLYNKDLLFCADDIRFKNEKNVLTENNWIGIWLNVPEQIRIERLKGRDGDAQVETLNHSSETAMNEFKDSLIQLDASGTLEQTYERIEEVLEYIRKEKCQPQQNN